MLPYITKVWRQISSYVKIWTARELGSTGLMNDLPDETINLQKFQIVTFQIYSFIFSFKEREYVFMAYRCASLLHIITFEPVSFIHIWWDGDQ